MSPDYRFAFGGDRVGDRRMGVACSEKPPVLGRRTLRALCLASLAVIVYGTLGPLRSGPGPWIVAVQHRCWLPPLTASDLDDVLTNFAVYVPVGVAFRLLLRRRGRAGWPDLLGGFALSAALSYLTEVLQAALPGRVSSLTDVIVDSVAALIGCLLATLVQDGLRRLHAFVFVQARSPQTLWTILAGGSLLATAVLMTAPWSLMRPRADVGFGEPLDVVHLQRIGTFGVIGFFLTGALRTRKRGTRAAAVAGAWALGAAAAVVLECLQLVLQRHLCSPLHTVESLLGLSAGCLAAAAVVRSPLAGARAPVAMRWLRTVALVALAAVAISIAVAGVSRDLLAGRFSGEPMIDWAPFHAQFHAPFAVLVTDVLQQLAAYSLLTALCLFLALDHGRAVVLLLLLAVVGVRECVRSVLSGHHADTTTPILAVVAWLVTTRIWASIQPRAQVNPTPL
jgi:VanZ family protein